MGLSDLLRLVQLLIQVVGPVLHHPLPAIEVLRVVVSRTDLVPGHVRKLKLDPGFGVPVLHEDGGCPRALVKDR